MCARSTLCSNVFTCAGSVESRTWSSGNPSILPKVDLRTSGHRLDPPMPRSRTSAKPPVLASSASRVNRWMSASWSCAMPSHPSHCPSSLPVQSDASRAQSRRDLRSAAHSASVCLTAAWNGARQVIGQAIDPALARVLSLPVDRLQQLAECRGGQVDAFRKQPLGQVLVGDARTRETPPSCRAPHRRPQ